MVLDQNGTVSELVQLLGVELRCAIVDVAVGIKELRRALDTRGPLLHAIHFAFPTFSELFQHVVLAGEDAPGLKIELVDNLRFAALLLRHRIRPVPIRPLTTMNVAQVGRRK